MPTTKKKLRTSEESKVLQSHTGYDRSTPLQETVIPLVTKGKSVVIESEADDEKTLAVLLGLMKRLESRTARPSDPEQPPEPFALLLTHSWLEAEKISGACQQLRKQSTSGPALLSVGKPGAERDESVRLRANAAIIAGPPERVIDHIRRGNLNLAKTQTLVIEDFPGGITSGSAADVQFILSKMTRLGQSVILTSDAGLLPAELAELFKSSVILTRDQWKREGMEYQWFTLPPGREDGDVIADLVYVRNLRFTVLIAAGAEHAQILSRSLSRRGIPAAILSGQQVPGSRESRSDTPEHAVLICTPAFNFRDKLQKVENVVFFEPASQSGERVDLEKVIGKIQSSVNVFLIARGDELMIQEKEQEKRKVKMKEIEAPTEAEVLKGTILNLLSRIRQEESPDELNRLRRAIRRNVPFFMRGYFMAYLFRELQQKRDGIRPKKGNFTTLFVGIGKNRKVFPRDILQLFQSSIGVARGDIGEIKVLDNYSFVDISADMAQKAIDAMNGIQVRGRKINVNFARKKDEE